MTYWRIRLGSPGNSYQFVEECKENNWIGISYGYQQDLTHQPYERWQDFNQHHVPIYIEQDSQENKPTKLSAGLACGALWRVATKMRRGDKIIVPLKGDTYLLGEISGDYRYCPDHVSLWHQRPVTWLREVESDAFSEECLKSIKTGLTLIELDRRLDELDVLFNPVPIGHTAEEVTEAVNFRLEKHLEDFLISNWHNTPLANTYAILTDAETGETIGQQFQTDTGPIDLLAQSHDGNTLLVVELKKNKASDAVVGQTLRYMGFVQETLAEAHQQVRGLIIAQDDCLRVRRALSLVPSIDFYRYRIAFELIEA
jgi:restriction system protein